MENEYRQVAITTIDNPFHPIDQWIEWLMFDMEKGYNTCALLDRIAKTSSQFSEKENLKEIERAIDEIVKEDPLNIYYKIVV